MDDALGDALVVEVGDLLTEVGVLEQRRPADAGLQRVVGVRDRQAVIGGEQRPARAIAKLVERGDLEGARGRRRRALRRHRIERLLRVRPGRWRLFDRCRKDWNRLIVRRAGHRALACTNRTRTRCGRPALAGVRSIVAGARAPCADRAWARALRRSPMAQASYGVIN